MSKLICYACNAPTVYTEQQRYYGGSGYVCDNNTSIMINNINYIHACYYFNNTDTIILWLAKTETKILEYNLLYLNNETWFRNYTDKTQSYFIRLGECNSLNEIINQCDLLELFN